MGLFEPGGHGGLGRAGEAVEGFDGAGEVSGVEGLAGGGEDTGDRVADKHAVALADGHGLLGLGPHAAEQGLAVGDGGLAGLVGGVGGLVEAEAEAGFGRGGGLGETGQSGRGAGDVAEFLPSLERPGGGLELSGALSLLIGGGQGGCGLFELGVERIEPPGQGDGLVGGLLGGGVELGLEGGEVDGWLGFQARDAALKRSKVDRRFRVERRDAGVEWGEIDGGLGFKLDKAAFDRAEIGQRGRAGFQAAEAGFEYPQIWRRTLLERGEARLERGKVGCRRRGTLLELVDAGLDGVDLAADRIHAANLKGGIAREARVLPEVDERGGKDDKADEVEHRKSVESLLRRRRLDAGAVARGGTRRGANWRSRGGGRAVHRGRRDGDGVLVGHSCASTWSKVGANDTRTRPQGKGASRSAAGWPMAMAWMPASAG